MTIVGKILVFVNLVFSLVVGGLVMMVYMTRTNWEDAFNKTKAQYNVVDADRAQLRADTDAAKKEFEAKVAALEKEKKDAVDLLDAAKREAARAKEELATIKQDDRRKAADGTALQTSVDSRREQVRELETANEKLRQDKTVLIQEKNEERKARIQADVEARTYKARNLDLESQVRDMARELIKSRSGPTSG
jgi:chromosome segregation ATPase